MADNPLFPQNDSAHNDFAESYLLSKKTRASESSDSQAAAAMIRSKLDKIYANEPDAEAEIQEVREAKAPSKHQLFMQSLSESGKSLADIQTEWHHYYVTLPDNEKHEVWQEFYESNENASTYHKQAKPKAAAPAITHQSANGVVVHDHQPTMLAVHPAQANPQHRKPKTIKKKILAQVNAGGKLQTKHHIQSLLFGLGMGFIVLVIFLFGFFNEVIIAPFIQPSRHASATPLILSSDGVAPTNTPEVIIPKINVEIPVDYTQTSTDENIIENALQNGVVHYPNTVMPGQKGNAAFFGHSSNNIFNKGRYKFAFVLLHTVENGDTFYLTNNGKVFVYKVISRMVVDPSDVGVLGPVSGQTATATLITCDPPGTSLHRLVVVGQQVSPDPSGNTDATSSQNIPSGAPTQLASNGPTLWSRFWHWVF